MNAIGLALVLIAAGAVLALIFAKRPGLSASLGGSCAAVGCLFGLVGALAVLVSGSAVTIADAPWPVPYGRFLLEADALSAFFLLPIFGVGLAATLAGASRLTSLRRRSPTDREHLLPGSAVFFGNVLLASLALVVCARNGVLFLVAWECMSLSSYFLVTWEDESEASRRASWVFLAAAHVSAACLVPLFAMLSRPTGSWDFATFGPPAASSMAPLFLLALVAFGTKAGLMPLHAWLPDAYEAAPGSVSALLSGAASKVGIYGLLRVLVLLGGLPAWMGWTLAAVGLASAVLGLLLALTQPRLSRVAAYSSVENLGLIATCLGIALVAARADLRWAAALAIVAACLHVLGHAAAKALLFVGFGAVRDGVGEDALPQLGGLQGRMPAMGNSLLAACVTLAGIPPGPLFVSELLLALALLSGTLTGRASEALPYLLALGILSACAGLALAVFARAFGLAFLGTARSEAARVAQAPPALTTGVLVALAMSCLALALASPLVAACVPAVAHGLAGIPASEWAESLGTLEPLLTSVALVLAGLVVALGAWSVARRLLMARRGVSAASTWACGYVAPSSRMQYAPSGFSQPFARLFDALLRPQRSETPPGGLHPASSRFSFRSTDLVRESVVVAAFRRLDSLLDRVRIVQHGRLHAYVLYIALALVVLFAWRFA